MRLVDYAVDLAEPLATASGEISSRRGTLVGVERERTVEDDSAPSDPVRGVGEAAPLPGWTESLRACRQALADRENDDPGEAAAALDDLPAARHGVTLAILDAAARSADESLATHLADRESDPAERVPVNATIGDGTPAETVAAAERAVAAGYDCLKLKAGVGSLALDVERIRAVREAVGDDVTVRVDANGAWTLATAERAIESLVPLDVAYVEQPLPAANLAGLADLRGRGIGVAVDEALTEYDLDDVLDADAADVVVLKPMAFGGLDRAREAAREARRAGVAVTLTTTIDAVVARTAAVHLAASLPDVLPCGLATGSLLAADLAADPAPVADGEVVVPEGPGIAGDVFDELLW